MDAWQEVDLNSPLPNSMTDVKITSMDEAHEWHRRWLESLKRQGFTGEAVVRYVLNSGGIRNKEFTQVWKDHSWKDPAVK